VARPAACRIRSVLIALAAITLLTGCAEAAPDSPFPPRPADIDVTGIDPCAALTPAEQADRGVGPGEPGTGDLGDGPTRICGWSNFDDGYNYSVQTLPLPAAVVVGTPDSTVHVVDGYGVVQSTAFGDSFPLCSHYIDASDPHGIRVQVMATASNEDGSIKDFDEVCGKTTLLTSQALRNLRPAG